MQSSCEYPTWTVAALADKIEQRKIYLPKFQRGVTWNEERQKKLIGSIRQGFPIGALLLSKSNTEVPGNETYSLIDGLQRTTAILKYLRDQTSFIGSSDSDFLPEWREFGKWVVGDLLGQEFTDTQIDDLLHGYISSTEIENIDRLEFYNVLINLYPEIDLVFLNQSQELKAKFESFKKSLKKSLDISGVSIPVIVFDGDESLLPEIFERLNSQGIPLNKYQIFAATWHEKCKIDNSEIMESIKSFYVDRMRDTTLEIDDVDEDGMPDSLTLFDYLTGFGSILCKRFPVLFDSSWSDYIAFQIATVAHQLPIGGMRKLPTRFSKDDENQILTGSFTNAVISTCQEVSSALEGRLSLKLNSAEQAEFSGHTAFQINTMITRILIEKFDPSSWEARNQDAAANPSAQMVRRWYLIDRIKDAWGNAGDSQFFRQVWALDDSDVYQPVKETLTGNSIDDLSRVLENWFDDQMTRRERSRTMVNRETKLVLRYFYYHVLSVGDENEQFFHIDHLVPVAWWTRFFEKFPDSSAPINSIGNLCLMINADNQHKKKKLPLGWFTDRVENGTDPDFKDRCEDKYFLIDPSGLGYPELVASVDEIASGDQSVLDAVLNGLTKTSRDRWTVIKTGILNRLAD